MHAYRPGSGQARTKLLYLFRSPSHVQIGRKPLDPEVREALEHTHPDLTFDWNGLLRDSPPLQRQTRTDPRERDRQGRTGRPQKPAGRQSGRPEGRPDARADGRPVRQTPPAPELPDDDSALGQALGAAEAARLRHRYAELVQRVGRRARTPEERDRLMGELAAVNPDEWAGPDVIQQQARGADKMWDAVAAQLPKRRRGRRGGQADAGPVSDGQDQTHGADVIIGERDNTDDEETHNVAPVADPGGDGQLDGPVDPAAATVPEHPETDVH